MNGSGPERGMSPREERALIAAILEGDRDALDAFHALTAEPLFRFVYYRLAGATADVDEVVQETYLSAMQSLHRFEGRASVQTWLHGIAKNHIAQRRRQSSRERVADLLEELDPEIDRILTDLASEELPEESLERAETEDLVGATLASLPIHYQEVLRAKYVDSLPVNEIARRQASSPKAVESTLTRARRAFQKTFELLAGRWRGGWRHA